MKLEIGLQQGFIAIKRDTYICYLWHNVVSTRFRLIKREQGAELMHGCNEIAA